MSLSPTLPLCFDCRFFATLRLERAADLPLEKREKYIDECIGGHCRRSPPSVGHFIGEGDTLEYDYGQWPKVMADDWCGAFESCQRNTTKHTEPAKKKQP